MSVEVKKDYSSDIKQVLKSEGMSILELSDKVGVEYNEALDLILKSKGRLIVTGMGKSGHIGKKIAATLASTGTPSFFLHPAEGLHGDLGMVTKDDVILAISNSGESQEILNIIPSIKRIGARMIALVGNNNSTLSDKSEVTLCYGSIKEACPLGLAPTTSTTLTLVIGDAIAIALLKAQDFKPENFAVFHPGGSLGRKLLLTVSDLIEVNKNNPVVKGNNNVKEVLFKMTESGLGAISIVDIQGKLIGILTDGDIRRALQQGNDLFEKPIEHLFNGSPITITSDVLAAEALKVMEEKRINVLPVIDEYSKPQAMLHMHDLTKLGL